MATKDVETNVRKAIFSMRILYGVIFLVLTVGLGMGILAGLRGQWLFSILAPTCAYGLVQQVKTYRAAHLRILETQSASQSARDKLPKALQ